MRLRYFETVLTGNGQPEVLVDASVAEVPAFVDDLDANLVQCVTVNQKEEMARQAIRQLVKLRQYPPDCSEEVEDDIDALTNYDLQDIQVIADWYGVDQDRTMEFLNETVDAQNRERVINGCDGDNYGIAEAIADLQPDVLKQANYDTCERLGIITAAGCGLKPTVSKE
jgi:hypothetical protein